MTERDKDERDLRILKQYEMGTPKAHLVKRFGVTKHHVYKLIKEALDDG